MRTKITDHALAILPDLDSLAQAAAQAAEAMGHIVDIQIGQAGRVALGPFLQPDGQPATVLPDDTEIAILGTTVAGVPTRCYVGTDKAPEAVAGQPGFFWVDLLPGDTESLKGIATLGAADNGPAVILWLRRAP